MRASDLREEIEIEIELMKATVKELTAIMDMAFNWTGIGCDLALKESKTSFVHSNRLYIPTCKHWNNIAKRWVEKLKHLAQDFALQLVLSVLGYDRWSFKSPKVWNLREVHKTERRKRCKHESITRRTDSSFD